MKKVNLYYYYYLGYELARLEELIKRYCELDDWRWESILENVKKWAENFKDQSSVFPRSQAQADRISSAIDQFKPLLGQKRVSTFDELDPLAKSVMRFHGEIEKEMGDLKVQ
jgi:hypothetical protein